MITILSEESKRNYAIVLRIIWVCQQGRKVLVLTDRREHADFLCKYIAEYWERLGEKTPSALARIVEEEKPVDYEPRVVATYLGQMKKAQRETATLAQVIVATYGMAFEALDIPRLDTLVMATPRSEIEQPCGRIMRPHPSKKTPWIIDVVDQFSLFEGFAWKHYRYFRDLGYAINTVQASDAERMRTEFPNDASYFSPPRFWSNSNSVAGAGGACGGGAGAEASQVAKKPRVGASQQDIRVLLGTTSASAPQSYALPSVPASFSQADIDALLVGN
jgi:hypothetical protein